MDHRITPLSHPSHRPPPLNHPCNRIHKLTLAALAVAALAGGAAHADASVALGSAGALERAGLSQDADKNGNAATFGSPVTDDRRLFKLRWRLPWLLTAGGVAAAAPFARGMSSSLVGGGVSLATEPTAGASALVPSFAIGEAHKLGQLQLGALSGTLGHGTLVDRYTNAPEGMPRVFGLGVETNLAGLGGQVMVGDALAPQSFIAARVYGRPVMWLLAPDATFQPNELDIDPRTETTGIWVTGISFAADTVAPSASGPRTVYAASWDNEAALLDNQLVKTIFFVDANAFGVAQQAPGFGVHPGLHLEWDVIGMRMSARGELFGGTDGYQARYFDRLYAIERVRVFGGEKSKLDIDRPATFGAQLRAQASLFKAVTVFLEEQNQSPMDPARGASSTTLTAGASAWLLFLGGSVVASQTGSDLLTLPLFGRGFVVTAEGRVGLIANVLHLVGRAWRAHIPAGDAPTEFIVSDGATVGLELNLDVL